MSRPSRSLVGSALGGGGAADVGSCADEYAAEARIMKTARPSLRPQILPTTSFRRFLSNCPYKTTITSRLHFPFRLTYLGRHGCNRREIRACSHYRSASMMQAK